MMLKNAFRLIVLGSFLLSMGCARTVEEKNKVLDFNVRLTFAGPVNLTNFRYYVILSPMPISIPAIVPSRYFPTPGETPGFETSFDVNNIEIINNNGINFYYRSFFSTWSDYIAIGPGLIARHYPSGSTTFDATTTNNARYQTNINFVPILSNSPSNTLNLRFPIQSLSPEFERIYFKFVIVKRTDSSLTGYVQDGLDDFSLPIEAKSGTIIGRGIPHAPSGSPEPAAWLESWEITIF